MKQQKLSALLLLVLAAALFTGCGKEPPKPQAVVINILAISEATGINEQIKQQMEAVNQQISEELKVLSDELSKEIEDEKTRIGDNPSAEDGEKLKTLQQQLFRQMMQAKSEGNGKLAEARAEIAQSFMDGIMLVAEKIALEHGASIILKANGVFWSEESVDITDEVIARMPGNSDSEAADNEPADSEPADSEITEPASQTISE
jgi:Skp family chaperone for outer membrane proteins